MTTRANEFKVAHRRKIDNLRKVHARHGERIFHMEHRAEGEENEETPKGGGQTEWNREQKTKDDNTNSSVRWGTPGTRYCSWKQKQTVACLLFAYLLLLPSVFMSTLQMPPSSLIFPIMIHVTLRGLLYNVYCDRGRWCWSSGFYWLLVSRWRVLARCHACGLCCYCHPSYPAAITIVINNHHQQDLDAFYIYLHGIPYLTPSYSMSQILIWSIINVWRQTISIASYYYL